MAEQKELESLRADSERSKPPKRSCRQGKGHGGDLGALLGAAKKVEAFLSEGRRKLTLLRPAALGPFELIRDTNAAGARLASFGCAEDRAQPAVPCQSG